MRGCRGVIRDIDYLYSKGANGIYFSDELFIPQREKRTALCEMLIERGYDLTWGCQMRLGVLNEDDVKLMYKAGCRWILFGIESGNPERIKTIKKNIDLSIAKETIAWCENAGMTVQASFIIGFPEETELKRCFAHALHLTDEADAVSGRKDLLRGFPQSLHRVSQSHTGSHIGVEPDGTLFVVTVDTDGTGVLSQIGKDIDIHGEPFPGADGKVGKLVKSQLFILFQTDIKGAVAHAERADFDTFVCAAD